MQRKRNVSQASTLRISYPPSSHRSDTLLSSSRMRISFSDTILIIPLKIWWILVGSKWRGNIVSTSTACKTHSSHPGIPFIPPHSSNLIHLIVVSLLSHYHEGEDEMQVKIQNANHFSPVTHHPMPWCYRDAENLSEVRISDWPDRFENWRIDEDYRTMFRCLSRGSSTEKGLWEGGSELLDDSRRRPVQPTQLEPEEYALVNFWISICHQLIIRRTGWTAKGFNLFYLE